MPPGGVFSGRWRAGRDTTSSARSPTAGWRRSSWPLQQGEQGFQKPVVLKRILPALAADPQFVRMLVDEAHIASTLNHSNLVQVLDLGKSGGQYFLVLEFVDGWSLEQIRRRAQNGQAEAPRPAGPLPSWARCVAASPTSTRASATGKPLGIVHRDVTPQNVLISQQGEVKLADFGIAKAVGKSEKSATGVIKGKFAYMSPEQSQARPLDARSDLFSVGTRALPARPPGRSPSTGRRTRTSSCRSGARGPRSPRRWSATSTPTSSA